MSKIVHARLDPESERILARLCRRTGWKDSDVIRRGIRALEGLASAHTPKEIIGLGRFQSGRRDLGSNKKHLRGFGRS